MRPDDDREAQPSEPDGAEAWLPIPPQTLAAVSAAFAALLLALSILHIHGFSLPCWHEVIDRSPEQEVVLGRGRLTRSDDWAVGLPAILSQSVHRPRFPVWNRLIGEGETNVLVGPSVPVLHIVTLFRLQLWGYFLGNDFGLAWHWWFRALALVYAFWLVFSLLSGGRTVLAMFAAIALLCSPFSQFWSMNFEPMSAMMALAFVAAAGLALCRSALRVLVWGALLAWAGGCFALSVIYPPFQVALAYLFLFLIVGWLVRERRRLGAAGLLRTRILVASAAALAVVAAALCWAVSAHDAIRLLADTVYPGRRSVAGGDLTIFRALNNVFTFALAHQRLTPVGNICEGASFYFVFPLELGCTLAARVLWKKKMDPVVADVGLFLILLSIHAIVGVPALVSRLMLLDRVEGIRAVIGLGVGDFLLWAAWMSRAAGSIGPTRRERLSVLVLAFVWGSGLFAVGLANRGYLPATPAAQIAATVVLFTLIGAAIAATWRHAAAALAAASILATAWFNPLVRGGSSYLAENPLARAILSLDREEGGNTRWIVYGDRVLGDLFRAIGVHALGGTHPYPQFGLWARLDPEGRFIYAYNRYAHVAFMVPPSPGELRIVATERDLVDVALDPANPLFGQLAADFVLASGKSAATLDTSPALRKIVSIGDKTIDGVVERARRRPP